MIYLVSLVPRVPAVKKHPHYTQAPPPQALVESVQSLGPRMLHRGRNKRDYR